MTRRAFYGIPPSVNERPNAFRPRALRRDAAEFLPAALLEAISRPGSRHHAVHENTHGGDPGRIHEAALRRRLTPGLGKDLLDAAPVGDQRVIHELGRRLSLPEGLELQKRTERMINAVVDHPRDRRIEDDPVRLVTHRGTSDEFEEG